MGKRGQQPIDKPDFWNKDWYLNQKKLGIPDPMISETLCISIYTLYRWKKQLGFKNGDFKHLKIAALKKGRKKQAVK